MILLEYNIYDSNSELGYMFGSYTVVGTPNVVFNGGQWFDPALSKEYGRNIISGPQSYEAYKARFDLLKSQQTTARITSVEVQTSPRLTATIEVTNLSSSEMDNARLYAVVYEDMRVSGSRYKVLDITPVEDKVRLAAGESKLFDLKSSITSNANRHMVVILKSSTGLVLQALKVR